MLIDKRLKIFHTAAVTGNFTRAAAILGMTQPNVTGQIRSLEQEFGTELFIRDGRQLRLTPAGMLLRREAEELLAFEENIVREVCDSVRSVRPLRLGATMTCGGYVLPDLMEKYWIHTGNRVRFSLHIANTEEIEDALKHHAFDLALVEGPFDGSFFFSRELLRDELVIAGHPSLPFWDGSAVLPLGSLLTSGVRFLLREPGSGTRFYFDRFCTEHRISPDPGTDIQEIGGFDAIKNLLAKGCGVTVISRLAIRQELENGLLRCAVPAEGRMERPLNFIYLESDTRPFAEEFIRFCVSQISRQKHRKKQDSSPALA